MTDQILLPPADALHTLALRTTAFPSPSTAVQPEAWWNAAVGESPDSALAQPRAGKHTLEGRLEPGKLVLSVEPLRIDWLFAPPGEPNPEVSGFPVLGPYPQILEVFLGPVHRWLTADSCPELQRMAFGAVVILPVENGPTAYRQLGAYLHGSVSLDPGHSSDFLYQINRPRDSHSGVEGLRVNRLSKWSAISSVLTFIQLKPQSVDQVTAQPSFAARIELDINTTPDFPSSLPREGLPAILEELVSLGIEILHNGDIP
jgi:hypothetical protein